MNPTIERIRALQGDTRRRARMRKAGPTPRPKLPTGAETAYVSGARGLVRDMHHAVLDAIAPALAELAGQRQDGIIETIGAAITAMKAAAENAITDAAITAMVTRIFDRVNAHNRGEMGRILSIDGPLLDPDLSVELANFRRANVDLIRSIVPEYLDEVRGLVMEAQRSGLRVEALRDQIAERYAVSQSRAELIARDQVLKANADLSRIRARRVGITEYVWSTSKGSTSKDDRVRADHAKLEGQTFSYSAPPVVDSRTGRRAPPGVDFQCRCVALPVIPD